MLVAGACAGPVRTIPPDFAATIEVGRTTLTDLTQALGEPTSRVAGAAGTSVTWRQIEPSTFGADHERRLVVDVVPSGVVRSFDYQSNVAGEAP